MQTRRNKTLIVAIFIRTFRDYFIFFHFPNPPAPQMFNEYDLFKEKIEKNEALETQSSLQLI